MDNGILTIREAKNGRDRLIPLSLSLQHLMQEYKAHMGCQLRDEDFFLRRRANACSWWTEIPRQV